MGELSIQSRDGDGAIRTELLPLKLTPLPMQEPSALPPADSAVLPFLVESLAGAPFSAK